MRSLTVISPVYNEAEVIESFHEKLRAELDAEKDRYESRIMFVLDRSLDGTAAVLKGIAARDPSVQVLMLSSRFGHQMSLLAGIDHASSDVIVMMDCDLQHPPETIHALLREHEKGNDVVYTVRRDTEEIGFLKRTTSRLFYRFINLFSQVPIREGAADFRLLSAKVVRVIQEQVRERNMFLRGLISWMGFNQSCVEFVVSRRLAGKSKYSLGRLLMLGTYGIVSFSKRPLQVAIILGVLFSAFGFSFAILTFVQYFIYESLPSGWTTIVILLAFFSGIQLLCLGIIGEYIGGIFDEVKGRPHYIVDEKINCP